MPVSQRLREQRAAPELDCNELYYDYIPRSRHNGHTLMVLGKHFRPRHHTWRGYWYCWCQDCKTDTLVEFKDVRYLEKVPA